MDLKRSIEVIEHGLRQKTQLEGDTAGPQALTDRMAAHGTPGLSIALVESGELAWAHGYGVSERGTARIVTPETLFQAGSISKPIAAVVALRLVDEGLIDLDRGVNEDLLTWRVPESELTKREKVTVRRILSHRAGLTVHGFGGYAPSSEIPSLAQILDGEGPANSDPIRVDVEPGSLERYSGGGFVLLQALVEDVTGRPFVELAEELVLRPFGMTRSTFEQPLPERWIVEAATGHWANGERVDGGWHVYPELAAAGLWTTSSDLARFAAGVLDAHAGRSNIVLRHETARTLLSPQGDDGRGLGFGLRAWDGGVRVGHGGSSAGFESWMYADNGTSEAVVIQTNAAWGDVLGLEVLRWLSLELPWLGLSINERRPADLAEEEFLAVAGTYEFDDPFGDTIERFELRREGASLATDASKYSGAMRFFPESRDVWFECDLGLTLSVTRNDDDSVATITDDLWGGESRRVGDWSQ